MRPGLCYRLGLTMLALSAGVDVYADWQDACEAVSTKPASGRPTISGGAPPRPAVAAGRGGGGGLGDDFIEDDEQDAEGEFADDD
jgi:transcription elongation factor Elf1